MIFDSDMDWVNRIKSAIGPCDGIFVYVGDGPSATANCHLDAFLLTPMQAERFGVPIEFRMDSCEVRNTIPSMLTKGLPPYVVAYKVELGTGWLAAMINLVRSAVEAFNQSQHYELKRIGTIPENLGITKDRLGSAVEELKLAWK
jgi:hypothetical protein